MKFVSTLFLFAGGIAFVVSLILAIAHTVIIAGPNGWLDLSLVCAIFSIAIKYVLVPDEKTE
jgi:hypothetical protein